MASAANRTLMLVVCFILTIPGLAGATTYYVDATSGSDSNNGTSTATPWKTVAKVNAAALSPGDSVLFQSGETWREQLHITSTGSSSSPITISSYGTGAKPVISGADQLSASWSLYSGSIYVATVGSITQPAQFYVDGQFYDVAHYPNSGYLTATANSADNSSIIDATLTQTASQLVGATVQARPAPWRINTAKITAYDATSHTLTLNTTINNNAQAMRTGYGFYLQNMLWMLDSPGEWFYDAVAGKLYLWTKAGDSPANHTVEVASRSYAALADHAYVTYRGLAFTNATVYNLYLSNTTNIIADNNDVRGGSIGIYDGNATNCTISNNDVENSLSDGIKLYLSVATSNSVTLTGNTINNAGNVGTPKQSEAGLLVTTTSIPVIATGNSITNSGNDGISLNGDQITIQNNAVDSSCLVLDDCGGIYTYGMTSSSARKTISGNSVSNSIGNFQGTPYTSSQAIGIYLDDGAHDTTITNNVVSNSKHLGIFIHAGYNNSVTGNTVLGSGSYGLLISEAGPAATAAGETTNNTVKNNSIETLAADATATYSSSIESSTSAFGAYDYNNFYHPNASFVVRNQGTAYSLSSWQTFSGQDLHSTDQKVSYSSALPTVSILAGTAADGTPVVNWTSTNATSCTASGDWSGIKPLNGTAPAVSSGNYTLTCTGRGGSTNASTSGSGGTSSSSPTPPPTVTLTASPTTVTSGGSSTLTWSSTNATSCTPSGAWYGSAMAASGSYTQTNITASGNYTMTCTGAGGSAAQTATITVAAASPPPTVTLTASPSTVTSGGSSTLNWSSTNATSCSASGAWSGTNLATSGSYTLNNLTTGGTYTVTCTGAGGSAMQSTTIAVSAPATPPTVTISASPSTVASGGSSTLTWSSTNATSCTPSGAWYGSAMPASGSYTLNNLTTGGTYTMTCTGAGGSAMQSTTIAVSAPPTVTISASPSTVASGGSSTLTWSSTNATSCTPSGAWYGSAMPASGSYTLTNITTSGNYTMTCTGPGGSAAQTATITASTPAPTVTFSASPTAVNRGGSSMLSWSTSGATSCVASGAWSGSKATSGSQALKKINNTGTYNLSCTGSGGTTSRSLVITVQ